MGQTRTGLVRKWGLDGKEVVICLYFLVMWFVLSFCYFLQWFSPGTWLKLLVFQFLNTYSWFHVFNSLSNLYSFLYLFKFYSLIFLTLYHLWFSVAYILSKTSQGKVLSAPLATLSVVSLGQSLRKYFALPRDPI